MADETRVKSGGMTRRLRVLLVVSLALNLLIIGTFGGAMFMRSKWQGHHPARMDFTAGPLTHALTHEDRRTIGRQMRKSLRDDGIDRSQLKAEFDGLIAELTATPFDAGAVNARLIRQRVMLGKRLELGQSLLLQRLEQMDASERAAYADRLRHAIERGASRHGTGRRSRE